MKIATYNIRNTQDQYVKRRSALKDTIQQTNADIIGLQEVAYPELEFLAEGYQIFFAPIQLAFPMHPDPEFRIDGNAILVKKGIVVQNHDYVHLSVFRNIQHIVIDQLHIYNTHLHHVITDDQVRDHQIDNILTYMLPMIHQKSNIILMGDFNLLPASQEYSKLKKYFKSSYFEVNKIEPDITFPTGLKGPFMDTDPPGTFDYIWITGQNLNVTESSLFGKDKVEENVYPSDHYGIISKIELK